jgi:outer membrane immunogenic protein
MKRLLGFGAALLATSAITPVGAADLGVDRYVYQPRPVAVIFRWTGVYIGLHAGGGFGKVDENSVPFSILASGNLGFPNPLLPFPGCPTNDPNCQRSQSAVVYPPLLSIGVSGWLAGGQIGANYQVGSWVWGIEAQASAANIKGSSLCTSSSVIRDTWTSGTSTCTSKIDALGTAAIRFGYTFERLWWYGKVGAAWINSNYQSRLFTNAFTFPASTQGTELLFSANELRWGWMVGTGLEYAFTDNWSAKIEYNYMDMGSHSILFTEPNAVDQPAHHKADITERLHVVKIGVNYRFGVRSIFVAY